MRQNLMIFLLGAAFLLAFVPAQADVRERPLLAIGRTAIAPVIDGNLIEAAWAQAASVPLFCDFQTGRPAPANTRVLAVWNDDCLFVGFRCDEPRMGELRATLRDRDSSLWGEDCVEVFLRPPGTEPYFHFIVNPLGTLYDALVQSASWNSLSRAAARKGKAEWTCELAIPWRDLGRPPAAGAAWAGNFNRTRRCSGEELSCWSITGGTFHNPEAFGELLLMKAAPSVHGLSLGNTLPGVNLFQANVTLASRTPRPAFLRLDALDGPSTLLQVKIAGDRRSSAVKERYELTPDDLRSPLAITLQGSATTFYRQRIAPDVPMSPSIADLRVAVAKPRPWGFSHAATDRAGFQSLRQQGQQLLRELDSALAAARQRGASLSRAEWESFVQSLGAFQQNLLRPVLWTAEPGSTVQPNTPPPSLTGAPAVDVALAQNERESVALRLRNEFLPGDLDLRLSLTDLRPITSTQSSDPKPLSRTYVTFMEAIPVPSRAGGVIVDPLSPLPPSGILHLQPSETREVWVTVDSTDVAPGYYVGQVTLQPFDPRTGMPTTTLPIRVRVWPIELPRQMPVSVFVCDYGLSARSPRHLEDLIRHHTNVLNTNGLPDPVGDGRADFSNLGEHLKVARGKGLLFLEVWFMRDTGWRPQYERWVREAGAAMQALGIPYEDWVLHIYDETLCDDFLNCAKHIKTIEPRLRIFTDCMGTPEQVKAFAPYVDFWCPHCGDLTKTAGLEAMRATGKPIWTYECGSVKSLPVGRYRALPWRAWRYKLDGVFFWCYPGSAWNELPVEGFNYGHIYEGYRGEPVSSKRWEAWSDGLEDLLLLRAYEGRLQQQRSRTPVDQTLLAEAQAVGDRNGGDPADLTALRQRIAHRLLELDGVPIAKDFPKLSFPLWPLRALGDGGGTARWEPGGHTDLGDLAAVVRSPTEKSWTFLVETLQAGPGDQVVFSLWAYGQGILRVCVSEGFSFGGDPRGHRITEQYLSLRENWQKVDVKHEVRERPVEAVVGFDYGQAKAAAVLSDAEVAVVPKGR